MTQNLRSRKFKVTVGGEEVELQFKRPDQQELFEIDKQYRIIYAAGIREGVMTEVEARRHFERQGTWTEAHDQEIRSIAAKIGQLEAALKAYDKVDAESIELASNINVIRSKMMTKIGDKQELFANTAEGLANEQKMHKFIELCCIRVDDDTRFFAGKDQYKTFVETEVDAMDEIHKEAYFFEYRLPEEVAKEWAEIEFADKIAEEAKKSADKARAERAAEEKKAAKKKTTRKRTAKKTAKKTTKKAAKKTAKKTTTRKKRATKTTAK